MGQGINVYYNWIITIVISVLASIGFLIIIIVITCHLTKNKKEVYRKYQIPTNNANNIP